MGVILSFPPRVRAPPQILTNEFPTLTLSANSTDLAGNTQGATAVPSLTLNEILTMSRTENRIELNVLKLKRQFDLE